MSKKHRTSVPDFSSKKPQKGQPTAESTKAATPPPTSAQRSKPPATSAKSGRRGG